MKTNLIGQTFGRLTVLDYNSIDCTWLCRCSCGNHTVVSTSFLKSGHTKLCGCYKKIFGTKFKKHGMSHTAEYKAWIQMKQRCNNPNSSSYPYYGGKGITVCERWVQSFESFLSDLGRKPSKTHSLDRIDPSGNYEPSNCRWATPFEQVHNRSTSLSLNSYQVKAFKTAIYPNQKELGGLMYCTLSLASETGELSGKMQKLLRDGPVEIDAKFRKDFMLEAGDILWNLGALANELGVTLEQIAFMNLEKLKDRASRNMIKGSGDNR